MIKKSKEISLLVQIASNIASDALNLTNNKITEYKNKDYSPEKLYECILQCYLFCGFPAAIESLKIFRHHYPDFEGRKSKYDPKKFKTDGKDNCKLIYKKNYKKLIENMNYFSPDLKEWMIIEGYGKVLSRKGLSLLEREFINVSILCTRLYVNQLHSHLKGCIHLGASNEDLSELLNSLRAGINVNNFNKAFDLLEKVKDKNK